MALLSTYVQIYGQLKTFFNTMREGQAPDKFNRQYLKDIGFKSSNFHKMIPLLKGLGFLADDGTPTQRYKDFLDKSKSQLILTEAVAEAYSDIFKIKANPTKSDKSIIEGKFKSTYNLSENTAKLSANTFLALLNLSDLKLLSAEPPAPEKDKPPKPEKEIKEDKNAGSPRLRTGLGLHYNIQIHLPATKDVEVYNAIFKSLKEHIID